ncbi:hypothetical protein DY037_08375 [Apilactobacillus micheneri]|uniref:hypothetical protein n=1 Tax=Apilactobacillus TaxID=2767877 RepID=UPI00112D6D77|nr:MULTISPECIES: hypothetical protein [Apilactobacillus]TPR12279.1 hypothetical protein DYZ97_07305 [Apilactobacillus timberlakei]TPR47174.1 hypothetical protein DY037_08375 [Apilactobacillus micheneri]
MVLHMLGFIFLMGIILFGFYSRRNENIRRKRIDQLTNSFKGEDRERWLEYLESKKRTSVLGLIAGISIGLFLAIFTFANFSKYPVYLICITLVFFILVLDVMLIILFIRYKRHNTFMGINLNNLYKQKKIYNLYPYFAFLVFHAYVISACYSVYILYK